MFDPVTWQVIAGIVQIIAAIFAAYTIWQARQMLAQADFQIKQSVAPAWDISSNITSPEFDHKNVQTILLASGKWSLKLSGLLLKKSSVCYNEDVRQIRHTYLTRNGSLGPTSRR